MEIQEGESQGLEGSVAVYYVYVDDDVGNSWLAGTDSWKTVCAIQLPSVGYASLRFGRSSEDRHSADEVAQSKLVFENLQTAHRCVVRDTKYWEDRLTGDQDPSDNFVDQTGEMEEQIEHDCDIEDKWARRHDADNSVSPTSSENSAANKFGVWQCPPALNDNSSISETWNDSRSFESFANKVHTNSGGSAIYSGVESDKRLSLVENVPPWSMNAAADPFVDTWFEEDIYSDDADVVPAGLERIGSQLPHIRSQSGDIDNRQRNFELPETFSNPFDTSLPLPDISPEDDSPGTLLYRDTYQNLLAYIAPRRQLPKPLSHYSLHYICENGI
ncbi:uncharacterized protein LY89DRAFT_154001 [Mollisia scopiformis]|uniref:Uncharacterized protein n=1 Tax=Mollisia scopiformis TaxID=149040 RepID=A0A194WZ07_MOLSC|nr:uncharacterized protein LY89DRAFT_154001 [Mollisia scopiformis]KUJ13190.1 hypothetical protein LY89DRAFT_154001 [Mollisia scopiformis]